MYIHTYTYIHTYMYTHSHILSIHTQSLHRHTQFIGYVSLKNSNTRFFYFAHRYPTSPAPSFLHWIVFTVKKKISWAYLCGCILDSIQICWSIYPPANTTGLKNIYLFVLGLSCGIWELVPWPGIKPRPPALGAQSLSHWTTREVPTIVLIIKDT